MRLLAIGTLLILYSLFLTPCFVEPSDIIISSGYIMMANEMNISPIIIWLWIMSGYIALIGGVLLGISGTFIHFKHPIAVAFSIMIFGGILSYWFLFLSGILS